MSVIRTCYPLTVHLLSLRDQHYALIRFHLKKPSLVGHPSLSRLLVSYGFVHLHVNPILQFSPTFYIHPLTLMFIHQHNLLYLQGFFFKHAFALLAHDYRLFPEDSDFLQLSPEILVRLHTYHQTWRSIRCEPCSSLLHLDN